MIRVARADPRLSIAVGPAPLLALACAGSVALAAPLAELFLSGTIV